MLNNSSETTQTFDLGREDLSQSSPSSTSYDQYSALGTLSDTTSGSVFFNCITTQLSQLTYEQYFFTQNTYYYKGSGNELGVTIGFNPIEQRIRDSSKSSLPVLISDSNDYFIYGPNGTVVEKYNITSSPPSSNPTFMYYVNSSSAWIITNFYRYDAYKNLTNGTQGSVFGYKGQYQDTSILYDMRAKFYSSTNGEFIQRDPLYSQTDQAYIYSADNPVSDTDVSWASEVSGALFQSNCFNSHQGKVQYWERLGVIPTNSMSISFPDVGCLLQADNWPPEEALMAARSFNWSYPVDEIAIAQSSLLLRYSNKS